MYFDSHTHLNSEQLFSNSEKYLESFESMWGKALVNVAVDLDRAKKALQISKNNNTSLKVLSTIGFHPWLIWNNDICSNNFDFLINQAEDFLKENKEYTYAIWECGIDTHYDNWKSLEDQKSFFDMQCTLAEKYNLPIVIHSRDDFYSTLEVLKKYPNLKIYFHCWWYWKKEVNILQESFKNVWIGYTWNITFPKADNIRESLLSTNKQNILMETDAPYLAPQVHRGQMNMPEYVKYIYEYSSELLSMNLEDYQKQIK